MGAYHVEYVIEVQEGVEVVSSASHRYRDFRRLHKALINSGLRTLPSSFPVGKLWFHPDSALHQRCSQLQAYLQIAVDKAQASVAFPPDLRRFLHLEKYMYA